MLFSFILDINKDVIKIYYHKNVKFLCQDLVDIVLKSGQYVNQSKKHHLVLKIVIAGLKSYLLFIAFSNLDPMVSIN